MKKILSVLLIAIMAFSLVACKDDGDVPDGMKLASNKDYVLYSLFVPEDWIVDESSATTVAHVSDADKSSVSVVQWNLTESTKDIDTWWSEYHKKELSETFPSFSVTEGEEGVETLVDSKAAKSYTYTVDMSGTTYKFYVTAVIDQGSIHIITYTSTLELYDTNIGTVKDDIIANFRLK